MAITIKTIPVLKKSASVTFNRKADSAIAKKYSVKFSKEISVASKILNKAKI